ncbi:hypothetical protein BB560_003042 [Smittium megazygosporum]|uniref:Uncharacterized protein n=1 Tax=Smittium megazygosporum TaxID=133381 RepID=A0A2T9ZD67_9FUNG|nr:hypothetical protein BB560_003042 [Smittium megazygosporum]
MAEDYPVDMAQPADTKEYYSKKDELKDLRTFGLLEFRYRFRNYFAEFFGTLLLLLFGNGVVALVKFNPSFGPAGFLMITIGWCFGLAMALYPSMGISGGHLNPAVTIAVAIFGRMPWSRVPGYIFSQILGAFTGAAMVYGIFRSKFDPFDGGKRQTTGQYATAGIFATYPDPDNTRWDSFFAEMVLTAILLFVIQGFFDERLTPAKGFEPIAVGLLVLTIGITCGTMTGYAINPARDLGPRLFTLAAGWGTEPFTAAGHYFWIPIVAPIVGGTIGVAMYEFFIIPNLD